MKEFRAPPFSRCDGFVDMHLDSLAAGPPPPDNQPFMKKLHHLLTIGYPREEIRELVELLSNTFCCNISGEQGQAAASMFRRKKAGLRDFRPAASCPVGPTQAARSEEQAGNCHREVGTAAAQEPRTRVSVLHWPASPHAGPPPPSTAFEASREGVSFEHAEANHGEPW